jgi:hypothetical protein
MKYLLLFMPLVSMLTGCEETSAASNLEMKPPIIVLDHWWNLDYVRNACGIGLDSKPCIDDATQVQDFEARFRAFFASDSSCHRIVLKEYGGESPRGAYDWTYKPHWMLMLDFHDGQTSQEWTMVRDTLITSGQGDAKEIAHTVCSIAKAKGGTLD